MIGLSKQPSYITNAGEGQAYQGYAKNPLTRASSGVFESAPWIQNNDYRYVMRWEDKNGNAILKQRYLGPRFVLDMDDIANEDFWAAPNNYDVTYPADVERIVPYTGIYDVAATLDPSNLPVQKKDRHGGTLILTLLVSVHNIGHQMMHLLVDVLQIRVLMEKEQCKMLRNNHQSCL